MGAQSIKIPVDLELSNLRNSISTLQNALKKIDPNSKQYENLSKALNKVEQQYRSLENASKRTFKNTTEINNFEKTFEKVAYSIENLASDFGRVKFKDLKIDIFSQEDIDRIQQAGQNVKDIQNEIDDLKITKLKELTTSNTEIQQLFSELKIDPDITSFEDTIKRVKQSISEVQKSLKTLNSKQKRTQSRKDGVDAKIAGISNLSMKGNLAEMFGTQFFDSSGQKYKEGGKQALTTYLASLGLDSKNIERVRKATAAELKTFAKEIVDSLQGALPNLKVTQKNLQNELDGIAADISKKTDELDLKNNSLSAIEGIDPAIKTELETLTNRLNEAYIELEKLKQELAETKGVSKESNDAIKNTGEVIQGASEKFEEGRKSAEAFSEASRKIGEIKSAIKQWFGFNEVINLTKNAVRNAINHIRELDKVMTEIAVVTDMTQDELWDQIGIYSDIAQQYGAATAGVYEVSQLYYQQGLQTAEVMELTEETLKMAKIANLDYADATDYMTVAIRGFKLEMGDAQNIVDVYSNIAAVTASDTEELAVAMSKTASSAEAVGSSFENTTAMIALMVETTREAPENIGSAMKSIISRYGEMTSDPSKLIDSEGEALSLNKVDKALQSVGISLQDAQGQFRDFDDVILELSEKWDTIDKNAQRYIATVMAGNRQQSRFLALVGNYERLAELTGEAANSQDAATLQTLKTMDSIETKINQLTVSVQEFYTSAGAEDLIKGFLDFANQLVQKLNDLPKSFGQLPVTAAGVIHQLITVLKNFATLIITDFEKTLNRMREVGVSKGGEAGSATGKSFIDAFNNKIDTLQIGEIKINKAKFGATLSTIGTLVSTLSLAFGEAETESQRHFNGIVQGFGTIASAAGQAISGHYVDAIITLVTGISQAVDTAIETAEERADRLRKKANDSKNEALLQKSEYNNLKDYKNKLEELTTSRYDSNEAYQEWIDYQNEIADKYPQLISHIDGEGNAIIDLAATYDELAYSRNKAAAANLKAAWEDAEAATAESENEAEDYALAKGVYDSKTFSNKLENIRIVEGGFSGINNDEEGFSLIPDNPLKVLATQEEKAVKELLERLNNATTFEEELEIARELASHYENSIGDKAINYSKGAKTVVEAAHEFVEANRDLYATMKSEEFEALYSERAAEQSQKNVVRSIISNENMVREEDDNFILSGVGSNLNTVIEDYVITKAEQYKDGILAYADSGQALEDYESVLTVLESGWKTLIPSEQARLMEIFNNPQNYSRNTFTSEIKAILGDNPMADLLISQWEDMVGSGLEVLDSFGLTEGVGGVRGQISALLGRIPPSLTNAISAQLEPVLQLKEAGDTRGAEKLKNAIVSLYNVIDNDTSLTAGEINKYATIISQGDLTSLSGIYTLKDALIEAGYDISKINEEFDQLAETIDVNLIVEWQTFAEAAASNLEFVETAIKNASEGMEMGDALAMAEKMGKSITDFDFKDGKWFFDDVEAIKGAYEVYNTDLLNDLNEETDKQIADLRKRQAIFQPETQGWWEHEEKIAELEKSRREATEAIDQYTEYMYNSMLLTNGSIEEFVAGVLKSNISDEIVQENIQYIREGNFSSLSNKLHPYLEQIIEISQNWVNDTFSSIFGAFGTNEIIDLKVAKQLDPQFFQSLVDKGIVKQIKGIEEGTVQVVQNASASLQLIAEALNVGSIKETDALSYVENIISSFSELGWESSLTQLTAIESTGSAQIDAALADGIRNIYSEITNAVSEAFNGEISAQGAVDLQEFFGARGIDLDFTETSKGLKLAYKDIVLIYEKLQAVDKFAAQMVFDEIANSTKEWGSGLDTVSSTMGTIAKLEEQIADASSRGDTTRLKQYQAELKVAKEILEVRSQEPESFSFMDQDLPDMYQGPLNYWDSVGTMYKTINESAQSGYMEVQDFYNIVNHMSNMVESAGGDFEIAGMNAAELIQAGFGALSNIDGEGAKINLSKLGIDFTEGVESMDGGFENGIKQMARQQIKMIDAAIKLLETIVAMEELGKIDLDSDGLEFDELFNVSDEGEILGFAEGVIEKFNATENALAKAGIASDKVKIGAYTLDELLVGSFDEFKALGIDIREYFAIMKGIVDTVNSEDFDPNNIPGMFQEIAQNLNQPFTIALDDFTLHVTPTGDYVYVDWTEENIQQKVEAAGFKSIEEARAAVEKYVSGETFETTAEFAGALQLAGKLTATESTYIYTDSNGKAHSFAKGNFSQDKIADIEEQALKTRITGSETIQGDLVEVKLSNGVKISGVMSASADSEGNKEVYYNGKSIGTAKTPEEAKKLIAEAHAENLKSSLATLPSYTIDGKMEINGKLYTVTTLFDGTKVYHDEHGNEVSVEQLRQEAADEAGETVSGEESTTAELTVTAGVNATISTGEVTTLSSETTIPEATAGVENLVLTPKNVSLNDQIASPVIESANADVISLTITPILTKLSEEGQATIQSIGEEGITFTIDFDMGSITPDEIEAIQEALFPEIDGESPLTAEVQSLSDALEEVEGQTSTLTTLSTTLSGLNLDQVATAMESILSDGQAIVVLDFSNFAGLETMADHVSTAINNVAAKIAAMTGQTITVDVVTNNIGGGNGEGTTTTNTTNNIFTIDVTDVENKLEQLGRKLNELGVKLDTLGRGSDFTSGKVNDLTGKVATLGTAISGIKDKSQAIKNLASAIDSINDRSQRVRNVSNAIESLPKSASFKVTLNVSANGKVSVKGNPNITVAKPVISTDGTVKKPNGEDSMMAKGNVALAKGTQSGEAQVKGTLMGELGPELVVAGGRYYTVGNNGAEFVDLPRDAIVFNHLQTKKLLGNNQGISGRGKPVTSEQTAVAHAKGTVSGPAMASASEALAQLYQLRAMWQALLDASAKDLGSKAGKGGGSGGSGGGGGGPEDPEEKRAYIHDLERWYNLLRQIEKLEQKITLEQAKRNNMVSGYDYADSLEKELRLLRRQKDTYEELSALQKDYYDKRRQDLLSTSYSKIFTYDEDGLMQYVDGENYGLDILAKLNETTATGAPTGWAQNSDTQIEYLKAIGFNVAELATNADGTAAENSEQMMENFWAGVDGWMEELDSLYDSYNDAQIKVQEAITAQNEILQQYIDNQLSVEEKLLQAILDREQAEIDRLQDEKDAMAEATQAYLDGLNDALNKEREMYSRNTINNETAKLQRQLAILQRTGGSASEIASLQDQIDARLQDEYFNQQQEQINLIQEASDKQLEKLQTQIDLMTETLEYQKANGLLWEEVYQMMSEWSPEQMLQFIEQYTQSYKENSALQNQEASKETLKELQIWERQQDIDTRNKAWAEYYANANFSDDIKKRYGAAAEEAFHEAYIQNGHDAAIKAADDVFNKGVAEQANKVPIDAGTPPTVSTPPSTTTPDDTTAPGDGSGDGSAEGTGKKIQFTAGNRKYYTYKDSKRNGKGQVFHGNGKSPVVQVDDETSSMYQISGEDGDGHVFVKRWISKQDVNSKKSLWKAYKSGGLIDYTGPAWVDGKPGKPESILSAKDTNLLKEHIFGKNGSLQALVSALEHILSGNVSYTGDTNNNQSVVIEKAEVIIQPGTISNDYDARRAGEMALEQIVKISRKTTNRTVSRR